MERRQLPSSIIDSPGFVENEPIGALAHLGIERAYALFKKCAQSENCL
jgi:hypothetical protein